MCVGLATTAADGSRDARLALIIADVPRALRARHVRSDDPDARELGRRELEHVSAPGGREGDAHARGVRDAGEDRGREATCAAAGWGDGGRMQGSERLREAGRAAAS